MLLPKKPDELGVPPRSWPRDADGGSLARMQRCCEVCEGFRPRAELERVERLVELTFGARSVVLCVGHARIAENSGARSLQALRKLYGRGRRSFVARRAAGASAASRERRQSPGRRASDLC